MKSGRVLLGLVLVVLLLVVGAMVYLMVADIPAPVTRVERVVPNDRLGSR